MLITVWCKDNQILLPIKNADLFIYLFLLHRFRWYICAAYKEEHINVEGKAVLGLPSTNCMASPTTMGWKLSVSACVPSAMKNNNEQLKSCSSVTLTSTTARTEQRCECLQQHDS